MFKTYFSYKRCEPITDFDFRFEDCILLRDIGPLKKGEMYKVIWVDLESLYISFRRLDSIADEKPDHETDLKLEVG